MIVKKLFPFLCLLAVFFSACQDEMAPLMRSDYKNRTVEEVIKIAIESYSDFYGREVRSLQTSVSKNNVVAVSSRNSRSGVNDTLYYVVNFDEDQGFALVSANPYKEDLLGISNNGNYFPDKEIENANFDFFMDCLENYLLGANNQESYSDLSPILMECPPKVHVLWGQRSPYGDECPNYISGCGPTAIAMVMSVFQQPQSISVDYSESFVSSIALDWEEIKKHVRTNNQCAESNVSVTHSDIAVLLRQIGKDASSSYLSDATSTDVYQCKACLQNYGYTCSSLQDFDQIDYVTALNANCVMFVFGQRYVPDQLPAGHFWIFDGYKYRSVLSNGFLTPQLYCHFNWGWNGKSNGYFLSGIFDASSAYSYDNAQYGHASNYYDYRVRMFSVTR